MEEAERKKKASASGDGRTDEGSSSESSGGGSTLLQQNILSKFYAKYAPEKTAEDVMAIIAKRASKGGEWFKDLCAKLETKYGEHPESLYAHQPDSGSGSKKQDSKKKSVR